MREKLMELVPSMSAGLCTGNAVDIDQLLAILSQVKVDIMADITRQHGELQKALEDKILLLRTVVDRVHTQVLRMPIDANSHEVSDPQSKKRKLSSSEPPMKNGPYGYSRKPRPRHARAFDFPSPGHIVIVCIE